jgi:tetratricopeptide (TPR) repeat protein
MTCQAAGFLGCLIFRASSSKSGYNPAQRSPEIVSALTAQAQTLGEPRFRPLVQKNLCTAGANAVSEANETGSLARENPVPLSGAASTRPGWPRGGGTAFANGEVLLRRFRIVRLLGSGGMGDVYEAEDLELGRVALKTIRKTITADPGLLHRFRQEVQLARRVSQPNVCRVHELYSVDAIAPGSSPTLFLSMEFLEGITLADKLQRDGPYAWREAEVLARQLCHGLDAIHAAGIIHRDLKTRNIMLVEKNGVCRAVLTDFGLAIDLPGVTTPDGSTQSAAGFAAVFAGTPDYMAPEQFEGRPLTPATDIYALGIVLYELVTAHQPFASDTPEAGVSPLGAAARRARRPVRPSSMRAHIPSGWDAVIYRCLEYDPAQRYASATEVAAALRARRTAIGRFRVGISELAHRPLGWSLAAVLLACIGGGIWFWRAQHEYHHPSSQVETWYEKGLAAIREGTYVKATLALQKAEDADPRFAMAHARLAEAWSELDFTGKAQEEMLQASTLEQQQHLPRLDAMYIHAVRDTLTHDSAGATKEYRSILDSLPNSEKADGYVDLGRALEKQGKIPEALIDYQKASRLSPDSPAAFVHIAILESRRQEKEEADVAFARGEALYRTDVNEEGLAEVAYQRGYAADSWGNTNAAEGFLNRSIEIAKQIGSVQLEIQGLTQLSSVASDADRDEEARGYASQAIQLARENGLDVWAALGLARLGGTYLDATDPLELQKAESPLQESLRIAKESKQTNAEAEAAINLASLRDRQHRADEVIPLAQRAYELYMLNGSVADALNAMTLSVRTQRNKGELNAALHSSLDVLKKANAYGNVRYRIQAEDLTGSIFLLLANYPAAVAHFQIALSLSRNQEERNMERRHVADALWRLGEYADAGKELSLPPAEDILDSRVARIRAGMLLSENKYLDVISLAARLKERPTSLDGELDLQLSAANAELHLSRIVSAQQRLNTLLSDAQVVNNRSLQQSILAARSTLLLKQGAPSEAERIALQATQYFHWSGQKDMEFFSLCTISDIQSDLGKVGDSSESAEKAIDILHGWEQTWDSSLVESFLRRPDIASILPNLGRRASFRQKEIR